MNCPWTITDHALRRYVLLAGCDNIDAARAELTELCAETWRRYQADPIRKPRQRDDGALVYRGPRPHQLRLVVQGGELISIDRGGSGAVSTSRRRQARTRGRKDWDWEK